MQCFETELKPAKMYKVVPIKNRENKDQIVSPLPSSTCQQCCCCCKAN